MVSFEDFDRLDGRKVAESIADWLAQETGRSVQYEKVEPGDERALPDREQRELDGVGFFHTAAGANT